MGWEGHAWVHAQLASVGLTKLSSRMGHTIQALTRRRRATGSRYCSHLRGSGGAAVVCALLARLEPALSPTAREARLAWERDCKASPHMDLAWGRAGALLACAEIEGAAPGGVSPKFVRSLHSRCLERVKLLTQLSAEAPVALGLGHGLAGYLLALESSRAVFGRKVPSGLTNRCLEILDEAKEARAGGGWRWPRLTWVGGETQDSWCHGAPGIALALLACHRWAGNGGYLALARRALEKAERWKGRGQSFCCGLVGHAQVMVEAYRLGGDGQWLERARRLYERACATDLRQTFPFRGFHVGRLGLQYLSWRLAYPALLPIPSLGSLSLVTRRGN